MKKKKKLPNARNTLNKGEKLLSGGRCWNAIEYNEKGKFSNKSNEKKKKCKKAKDSTVTLFDFRVKKKKTHNSGSSRPWRYFSPGNDRSKCNRANQCGRIFFFPLCNEIIYVTFYFALPDSGWQSFLKWRTWTESQNLVSTRYQESIGGRNMMFSALYFRSEPMKIIRLRNVNPKRYTVRLCREIRTTITIYPYINIEKHNRCRSTLPNGWNNIVRGV